MACGIYKITNQINGHSYIGQSIHIQERWSDEKHRAFNPNEEEYNKTLSKAFRKYGIENFKFEILIECEPSELNNQEIYYIALYNTYFNGYNETTGGSGSPNAYLKISKEQLLEIYNLLQNTNIPQKDIAIQYNVGEDVISTINQGKSRRLQGYNYPLRKRKEVIESFCKNCGKKITYNSIRCPECQALKIRVVADRPTKEELYQILVNNQGNFTKIGKQFNVSDNAIRKWCKSYDLPTHSADYKSKLQVSLTASESTPSKSVRQLDINTGKELNQFSSLNDAGRFIAKEGVSLDTYNHIGSRIGQVCNGKRKTAYGYKWEFLNPIDIKV